MSARRIPLIVGILLALGTGVLLLVYVGSLRGGVPVVAMKSVIVATRDIPARAEIVASSIASATLPETQLDSDAVTDGKSIVGSYSLITIPARSVLTRSKIGPASALALPSRLPIGIRAVSIAIDRVKGVSGLIQPGDRVDVVAVPPRVGNETPQASAIVRGALVLAMGNQLETVSSTPSPDNQNLTTITLALTPQQVDLVAAADLSTTLRLALRSPKDSLHDFPVEPLSLGHAAVAAPAAAVPAGAGAAVSQSAPAVREPSTPKGAVVIEGDRIIRSDR